MNLSALYILSALSTLVVLSIHEYSHALVANKLGDPTAKSVGRLSLNPLKHLDPVGALCMVFFHFGWAKPVPINPRYFKNPKRDFALTAMAGPLSNLLCAFVSTFLCGCFAGILLGEETAAPALLNFVFYAFIFLLLFTVTNLGIAIFNLIPIPPLDGSRLLNALLPPKTYFKLMKYERYFYYGILIWLLLGDFLSRLLTGIFGTNAVTSVIASILSLSDLLSIVMKSILSVFLLLFSLLFPNLPFDTVAYYFSSLI